jgi:hypothetical protein
MPITNRASLIHHLQWALEVEHSTIPPYLCALYSLKPGTNEIAASIIRSVVMEEMLHMTLVANLMNAVGGRPNVDHPRFVPQYPAYLPHSRKTFRVQLRPFSKPAIDTFLKIERPAPPNAKPQGNHYSTIGQFYEAVADAVEHLARKLGEKKLFCGRRALQISGNRYYYGAGGEPIAVTDLASARAAIAVVVEQGEGLDYTIFDGDFRFGQVDELAHYFRFMEIRAGRRFVPGDTPSGGPTGAEVTVDWDGRYPMRANPKVRQYRSKPEIHRLMVQFNERYTSLLGALHDAFNGKQRRLLDAVPHMYELKYLAQTLMAIPSGRNDGTTAGPSFEYEKSRPAGRGRRP